MINVPIRITNEAQTTPITHLVPLFGRLRLSYSHIAPSGCIDMNVASRAPTSEMREPKFGTAEQMTYAASVTPSVHDSHVIQ